MVTQIQLGNFFNSGGRTVAGGAGGSGLDTQSIIKSLTEAKRIPASRLEDRIKSNDKKIEALGEFRTLMSKMKDAVNFLRNPPGVQNSVDNVFRYTTATVSSNSSVAGSSYISATAAPGALIQDYVISDITSVARARKQTSALFSVASADTSVVSASPAGVQFKAGTFNFNGRDITLSEGDSLNAVAAKFNAVSGDTKVSASVVKVANNSYQLVFTATATGTDADFDFNNVDVIGTLDDDDDVFDLVAIGTQQTAANATFKFNGTTITRQSNSVGDLVGGLTLNILQKTPDEPDNTEITVSVKPDEQVIKGGIINFVNAYNDLKLFAAKQTKLNDAGTYDETAVLSDSNVMRSALSTITSQLSTIVGGITGGNPNRLADLGITSTDLPESDDAPRVRNVLNVDDTKLAAAINSNFDGVRRVFEFDFTSTNPNLRVFSRTNALAVNNFSLSVNPYAVQTTKVLEVADADTAIVAADPTEFQFRANILSIGGQAIELEAGDTLNIIAQKFNDRTADTGMSAQVIEVSAGKFQLKFTSTGAAGINNNLKSATNDPDGVFDRITFTVEHQYKATYNNGTGPVTVDVDGTLVSGSGGGEASGVRLSGKAGTPLEGLVLVYAGIASSVNTITATQGIADRIFNTSDNILKDDTGPLEIEIETLKTAETRFNDEIKRIDEQVERFRQELIAKFGALEQAIARTNTLLQSIDAQNNALNNSN
jgi:flagellar hook-associated protein 2